MHVLEKYWLCWLRWLDSEGVGKVLRVLSEEEEVSEWLIPRLRGVSELDLVRLRGIAIGRSYC